MCKCWRRSLNMRRSMRHSTLYCLLRMSTRMWKQHTADPNHRTKYIH